MSASLLLHSLIPASLDATEFGFALNPVIYDEGMLAGIAHGDGKVFLLRPDMGDVSRINVWDNPDSLTSRHIASGNHVLDDQFRGRTLHGID